MDLYDLITKNYTYEPKIIIKYIFEIAKLLKNENVLHRDLHPKNFLIFKNDGHYLVKIADFGLSKIIGKIEISSENPYKNKYKRYGYGKWLKNWIHKSQRKNISFATFKTETYSFAKIINFCYTKNSNNYNHELGQYCVNASLLKYNDINEMILDIFKNDFVIYNTIFN